MSHNDDTQVQAALVVIISQLIVPIVIKSAAYVADKILNWVIAGDNDAAQESTVISDVLVATFDGSSGLEG